MASKLARKQQGLLDDYLLKQNSNADMRFAESYQRTFCQLQGFVAQSCIGCPQGVHAASVLSDVNAGNERWATASVSDQRAIVKAQSSGRCWQSCHAFASKRISIQRSSAKKRQQNGELGSGQFVALLRFE